MVMGLRLGRGSSYLLGELGTKSSNFFILFGLYIGFFPFWVKIVMDRQTVMEKYLARVYSRTNRCRSFSMMLLGTSTTTSTEPASATRGITGGGRTRLDHRIIVEPDEPEDQLAALPDEPEEEEPEVDPPPTLDFEIENGGTPALMTLVSVSTMGAAVRRSSKIGGTWS